MEFEQVCLHIQYRANTQRRIIDRQKRGILTSRNELCGAHYHNLWSLKFYEGGLNLKSTVIYFGADLSIDLFIIITYQL